MDELIGTPQRVVADMLADMQAKRLTMAQRGLDLAAIDRAMKLAAAVSDQIALAALVPAKDALIAYKQPKEQQ